MQGFVAIPELLSQNRVRVVMSMLGGTNVPWIGSGVHRGLLQLIKTRHEETAVSAAVGYARSTGSLGVCSVTGGPGFANSVNALRAAALRYVPILMIVSESPRTQYSTEQSIDQRRLAEVIGAGFHHVARGEELQQSFWQAVRKTRWNGCPQILSIGDGVLDSNVQIEARPPDDLEPSGEPDPDAVGAAVRALAGAQRPLVIAGQGALVADCRDRLIELADLIGARVATTLSANRFFSGHSHDLGLCGDWSPRPAYDVLSQADAVLAIGASLNEHTLANGQLFHGAKIIQCEVDPDRPFRANANGIALVGDAALSVEALIEEWKNSGLEKRAVGGSTPAFQDLQASMLEKELSHDPARGLDLRRVYVAFDRHLPADRVVVTDAGRSLGTLPSLVNARDARSWLVGRGYASIGQGLGIAIGAAAANPDRLTVLFCGDGGFMMSSHDLDAIRLNGLNVAIVIMNDEMYGSDARHLAKYGLPLDIISQSLPDIQLLAAAFGGKGYVIRTEEEIASLTFSEGLTLIDVRIDPEVNARDAYG